MNRQTLARLDIVAESDDYLVLNKPGDLVCHPTKTDEYSSLIGRLRLYLQDQPEVSPHFVNRLDRETSGLVLVSKNPAGHKLLCQNYEQSRKVYWAVVHGWPESEVGVVDAPLGPVGTSVVRLKQGVLHSGAGKPSRTHWRCLSRSRRNHREYAVLEVTPENGRMHQIRVHLAHIGHAVVGDKLYGADESLFLEMLDNGWNERLAQALESPRHLLSALEMHGPEVSWTIPAPADIRSYIRREGE